MPLGRKYSFRRCSTEPGWYRNQSQYTGYSDIKLFLSDKFVKLIDFDLWVLIWVLIQTSIYPTSFQVSSTRLIRYVNSSMVLDIDFGSIQNWMYEYLYIWYFSLNLKKSLLRLKLAFIFNQSVYYLFNKIKISSDDFLRKDVIDNFQTSYLF